MTKFWVVWNPRSGPPEYRHHVKANAKREAERLSSVHGGTFYVLECIGRAEKIPDVVWHEASAIDPEELPF